MLLISVDRLSRTFSTLSSCSIVVAIIAISCADSRTSLARRLEARPASGGHFCRRAGRFGNVSHAVVSCSTAVAVASAKLACCCDPPADNIGFFFGVVLNARQQGSGIALRVGNHGAQCRQKPIESILGLSNFIITISRKLNSEVALFSPLRMASRINSIPCMSREIPMDDVKKPINSPAAIRASMV